MFNHFLHLLHSDSCVWHLTKAFNFSIQPNFRAQQDVATFQSLCSMNFSCLAWQWMISSFLLRNYSDHKCIMAGHSLLSVAKCEQPHWQRDRQEKDAATVQATLFCLQHGWTNECAGYRSRDPKSHGVLKQNPLCLSKAACILSVPPKC